MKFNELQGVLSPAVETVSLEKSFWDSDDESNLSDGLGSQLDEYLYSSKTLEDLRYNRNWCERNLFFSQ